jgi:hypothetical protein
MILQLGSLPSPPPTAHWMNPDLIFGLVAGTALGILLTSGLYVYSRGFRKYLGASKCIYCEAPAKPNSFICFRHTRQDEVEL